jgi:hypothetical protein
LYLAMPSNGCRTATSVLMMYWTDFSVEHNSCIATSGMLLVYHTTEDVKVLVKDKSYSLDRMFKHSNLRVLASTMISSLGQRTSHQTERCITAVSMFILTLLLLPGCQTRPQPVCFTEGEVALGLVRPFPKLFSKSTIMGFINDGMYRNPARYRYYATALANFCKTGKDKGFDPGDFSNDTGINEPFERHWRIESSRELMESDDSISIPRPK